VTESLGEGEGSIESFLSRAANRCGAALAIVPPMMTAATATVMIRVTFVNFIPRSPLVAEAGRAGYGPHPCIDGRPPRARRRAGDFAVRGRGPKVVPRGRPTQSAIVGRNRGGHRCPVA